MPYSLVPNTEGENSLVNRLYTFDSNTWKSPYHIEVDCEFKKALVNSEL